MSWKQALKGTHRESSIEALNKELDSLQKTILTRIMPDHPSYDRAKIEATPGRLLLDIKRSGMCKVRGVKQCFREDTESTDGVDFNCYSNVIKLHAVRTALFPKRASRNHQIGINDVSVAFLQSNKYTDGKVKYICFKHPVTGEWQYF